MLSTVPSAPAPAYLTRKQAAEYIGVVPKTIDNMVARGDLKVVRFGPRIVRVTVESIQALAARGAK